MASLTIDSIIYDVGADHGSLDDMVADAIARTINAWQGGADLVVFPEYCWCNLMLYSEDQSLEHLAGRFWTECWPRFVAELSMPGKAVLLGSVPFQAEDGLRNRAAAIIEGQEIFQDKLCLTPWESHLIGGERLAIFEFAGAKIVILICLDIEIPATAELLKQDGTVDLILVPSATESLMGVERIARCASARAVELGCGVVVSQIVGEIDNDFVGDNSGQAALYLPSLSGTDTALRVDERGIRTNGDASERFVFDLAMIRQARADRIHTNPALVFAGHTVVLKKM